MVWTPYKGYGSLADEIILYLREMKVINAHIYAPYYVASIGAHIANMGNIINEEDMEYFNNRKGTLFYTVGGRPIDIRTHLLFVAPPGCGKSMMLNYFMDDKIGFLQHTPIPFKSLTRTTEAGLIGSGKDTGGNVMKGDVEVFKNAIFGIHEASSFFMKGPEYDMLMKNTLLQILDNGNVYKKLSSVAHEYKTYATFWMNTQPTRLDLSHGLGRRVLVLQFNPTEKELNTIRRMQKVGIGVSPNFDRIKLIREMLTEIWNEFNVKEVRFTDKMLDFIDKDEFTHTDVELVNKLAIGWNIMVNYEPGDDVLEVNLIHGIKDMIINALNWKYSSIIDGLNKDLVNILDNEKKYSTTQIKTLCVKKLGLTYRQSTEVINDALKNGILVAERIKTKGRPTVIYKLAPPLVIAEQLTKEIKLDTKGE